MTKAVGYIRVSTEEQTQHGYSLEAQAQAIKKYCELQGWELVRIYRDDGYSGASMERPDLQQLLEDVYLRKFDVVVVWKLDRLSRNLKDTLYLLDDALEKNGIGFISIQEQFDTTTPIGKAVMQIIAVFAQLEREMITERMKMGKYQKARLGQFPGGHVLYGYRKNPQTGEFEINEEEARIVRLIYHWYVYGDESGQPLGMEAIADKLTNMGVLPPSAVRGVRVGVRGKRGQKGEYVKHWSNATVRQILTHQAYIGKNYFGRDGKNAEPEYTKDDWIPIPFPQIVDDHIYQLAQERRKRAKFWQRKHETPLLTSIIHCGVCGLQFRGTYDHGKTAVYSCYGRLKRYHRDGSPTCDSPRIPADWLDQQVVLKVFEALQKPEQMKEAIMAHLESWERRKRELELLVGPSVKQMKELQDEQERLNYLFRKGRISVSEYEKEASALDKKIAELREQHKHQTNELRHLQKLEKDLDFIKQAIENGYWKVEYEALQSEIKMMWDAALTIDNKTGEVVITTPRQEKKVTIDFSEAGKQVQEQEELLTFAIHGGGKIATRQLFDRLHITVHVYHDRVEVRGLIPVGNINISSFQEIIGKSPAMLKIYKTIGRIAEKDITVLITGESGTGKELIARAIHQNSRRKEERLVAVNITAIPKELLESELFGYEKGAFTGATIRKQGRFEEANRGTLLLDEIGDMPFELQTKLLRVLEEKRFYRLGSEKPVEVDVRVIASTNKNLEEEVALGRFRKDLYYRLNGITIEIPPLRERKEDIPLLVEYFIDRYGKEFGIGKRIISEEAKEILLEYNWPGNVRELENTIKRVLVLSSDSIITADILLEAAPYLKGKTPGKADSLDKLISSHLINLINSHEEGPRGEGIYGTIIKMVEKPLIETVLKLTRGNKKKAASLLGINRNTLSKKIEELGIYIAEASD